jgi:hypothetical protein
MAHEQARKEWEDNTESAPKTVTRGKYKKRTDVHPFRRFGEALAWLDWNDDIIEIKKLETLNPENGGPTKLLKFLQSIADKHGLQIFAGINAYLPDRPAPEGKLPTQKELEKWYGRRGFQIKPNRCGGALGWYPRAPKE